MLASAPLLASLLYWFTWLVMAGTVAIVVLSMAFGAMMTLRWFLKGGKTKPGAHG